MLIDEIGFTDDTALLCHTNYLPSPNSVTSGGDWFGPNGTRVLGEPDPNGVPGFVRSRDPNVVRLKKLNFMIQPEGVYKCVIQDDTLVNRTIYVTLYGMYIHNNNEKCCIYILNFAATPPPLPSSIDGDPVVPTNSLSCGADIITRHSTLTRRTSFNSLTPTLVADYTYNGGISKAVATYFTSNSFGITATPTNPTFSS